MINEHLCLITEGYPTIDNPEYAFIKPLVGAIADSGIKCSVIVPQSITKCLFRKKAKRKSKWVDFTAEGNAIDIYQPSFTSFSNMRFLGCCLSTFFRDRVIRATVKRMKHKPTVLYGHFWGCGIVAASIGAEYGLPVFVATGESTIKVYKEYKKAVIAKYLKYIKGVICVSTKNKQESIQLGLTDDKNTIVIPNSINTDCFYLENKLEMRKKYGFPADAFIVVFVGEFSARKGVLRLSQAIELNNNVKSIFVGRGALRPTCKDILFCGQLQHDEVIHYLNCADVFILPTLAEGCCNAIIEAMACGLPIISSDLPFNHDVLDDKNAILIDPDNVEQIGDAIKTLRDNSELRNKMSKESLKKAEVLDIQSRAANILAFLAEKK